MPIAPGENVGPYRIIAQLGSGGMATVFKAYHPALDRYVAIKVLHPAFKADPQFFERFKREARIVANLEHPNIIPVYDFSEHYGEPYLVMRFVEGSTLKPEMDGQPLDPVQILRLMRPVCQAVAYAHKEGVLHRDLKPSNIMVSGASTVFLTDFGLARMVQRGESTLSHDVMVGTPQYISPEQAQGVRELDARTDIYSLGVILFEMLTGRVPFNADTPFATVHDHIYAPLPLPRSLNPTIDPAVERVLLKALAKNPDDRFATAEELLEALEATLGTPGSTLSLSRPQPETAQVAAAASAGLPWWVWVGAPALVAIVLGLMVVGLLFWRNGQRNSRLAGEPVPTPVAGQIQPAEATLPAPLSQPALPTPTSTPAVPAEQPQRPGAGSPALYQQAIRANPQDLPAYYGLAEALLRANDQAGALAALEQAVANNPENVEAIIRLGRLQQRTGDAAAALATFEKAVALAPQSALPYAAQAIALLSQDQDDAAKAALDQALALDPDLPEAHLASGMYLFKQGDRRGAWREFRVVVRSNRALPPLKAQAQEFLSRLSQ